MAKREIGFKNLHTYKDVRGKLRAYFNPPNGKKIPLPLPVGSPEFLSAYLDAAKGIKPVSAVVVSKTNKVTFNTLLRQYFGSKLYAKLAPSTKSTYKRILEGFCEKHGEKSVIEFKRKHALSILGSMSDRPEAANGLMKRLITLLNYAVEAEVVLINPLRGIKPYPSNEDGYHTWTDGEIEQFVSHHPVGTKAYLAMILMLETGQRRSDAIKMGWGSVSNSYILVAQQKTKTRLRIPISDKLREALDLCPQGNGTFLMTEHGRPFTSAGFGNWMRDRCSEAELRHCTAHGLRKACSRRLAESGCTLNEIKSITGHKTDAEVRRYTDKADQQLLATRAVEKLKDATTNRNSANDQKNVSKHEGTSHVNQ